MSVIAPTQKNHFQSRGYTGTFWARPLLMHGIKTATLQCLAAVATLYFQKGRKKRENAYKNQFWEKFISSLEGCGRQAGSCSEGSDRSTGSKRISGTEPVPARRDRAAQ